MTNRATWECKGFMGYRNQDPDKVTWQHNGKRMVTDLALLRRALNQAAPSNALITARQIINQ